MKHSHLIHGLRLLYVTVYTHALFTYRRIFSAVLMMSVLAEGAATIQLNIELVVVAASSVHVHAVRVIGVAFN